MALSDDTINRYAEACTPNTETGALNYKAFARAIEAEVRKDDEALIRQMESAISWSSPHADAAHGWKSENLARKRSEAITAARARLLDSDLSNLTERGAKAWAGVDAQGLREGFTAADMATVSAQGFRDGWTAAQAISAEPAGATEMENLQRTAVGWQERALRAERNWVVCRRWAIAGGAPVEKLGDDPDQPFHAASPAIDGESNG